MLREAASSAASIGSALSKSTGGSTDDTGLSQFADGGFIHGPGTGTSDSILARVSNGEFINRSAAVDYYGPGFFHALNKLDVPRFAMGGLVEFPSLPRFAEGGQ